jgi:DNA-binding response OmpR family regulator
MKILLIDDTRLMRRAIERALTKAGYGVISSGDGEEGLRLAAATNPNLILLDMMLPGLDGVSVLRRLKQEPSTSRIPVIVLSGLSQNNEAKLMKEGAAKYVEKSDETIEKNSALFRVIEDLLRGAGSEESLLATNSLSGRRRLYL